MLTPMAESNPSLATKLVRNIDETPTKHRTRGDLYESTVARLSQGTEAKKLSARVERVPAGKRADVHQRGAGDLRIPSLEEIPRRRQPGHAQALRDHRPQRRIVDYWADEP
jgi:hypothetical protein